jgi:hypothetical protein
VQNRAPGRFAVPHRAHFNSAEAKDAESALDGITWLGAKVSPHR